MTLKKKCSNFPFNFYKVFKNFGFNDICGIDEAGYGRIAGDIIVAIFIPLEGYDFNGIRDSKKLSFEARERKYKELIKNAKHYKIIHITNKEIEKFGNIFLATQSKIIKALKKMRYDLAIVDGCYKEIPRGISIPQADVYTSAVSAASIIAKVYRDRMMIKLHEKYPQYNWAKNKGYPTPEHLNLIKKFGSCEYHRKKYREVYNINR